MGSDNRSSFGLLLREFRYASGLSQELLAERARISHETIGALERGVRTAPQRETLALLIEGLRLTGAQRQRFEEAAAASRRVGRPRVRVFGADSAQALSANPVRGGPVPNNLPRAVNSFRGRERELAELQQQLQTRRLITLHGAGGSGKTRLALEVARAQLANAGFSDGIWFVDLASLIDRDLVPATIARVLRVGAEPGRLPSQALVQALLERRLLLILDNCEHLLEMCACVVQDLLSACDSVNILATSREALEVDGELRYQVDPLPMPAVESGGPAGSPARWAESPAFRLFLDRAEEADPRDFPAAAAGDPSTVARICAQLDGLPLALELAAARTQDLSLREIADGVESRFSLLVRGRRAAAPRHQTLRGMLDWSYDLLTERDRSLFRRLAAFTGTWTTAAAVAVCSDTEADGPAPEARLTPEAVRDGVATLISKSLLVVERREREPVRYRFLESTREYARVLLEESGERAVLARRHALYYLDFLRRAGAVWRADGGVTAAESFDKLLAEFHQVEAAAGWAVGEQRDLSVGADLVAVLIDVWVQCSLEIDLRSGGSGSEAAADREPDPIVPLERGIISLLSVLEPSDVLKTEREPGPARRPTLTVDPSASWVAAFPTRHSYRAGDVLFRKGDDARELLYILSGTVVLEEIAVSVGPHELLGEIAFFSPLKRRTASATCATDVSVLSIALEQMVDLYMQNATFRSHVIRVLTSRLIHDIERVRHGRATGPA